MNIFKPPGTFGAADSEANKDVAAEGARWTKEAYDPARPGGRERKTFATDVGIAVDPLYTPAHLERIGFDYQRDLGFPGEYPFTRGDRPGMNRTDPFVVSAYSGFGDAQACSAPGMFAILALA